MKTCEACNKDVKKLFVIYYFGLACSACFIEWYEWISKREEQFKAWYKEALEVKQC